MSLIQLVRDALTEPPSKEPTSKDLVSQLELAFLQKEDKEGQMLMQAVRKQLTKRKKKGVTSNEV